MTKIKIIRMMIILIRIISIRMIIMIKMIRMKNIIKMIMKNIIKMIIYKVMTNKKNNTNNYNLYSRTIKSKHRLCLKIIRLWLIKD